MWQCGCFAQEAGKGRARGAVLVLVAASLTMLMGFAALAIDVGYLYAVHTELRNVADASAMAGASALVDDSVLQGDSAQDDIAYLARARAHEYAGKNEVAGRVAYVLDSDVLVGYVSDPYDLSEQITVAGSPYNAVRVRVAKSHESPNGPAELLFARVWGQETASLSAESTAYVNANIAGYRAPSSGPGVLIPLSVRKWRVDEVLEQAANGGGVDEYGFDPETGEITSGPDGIPELMIYPFKQKDEEPDSDNPDGAGNFGILNFGATNSSAVIPARQIETGLLAEDLMATIGQSEILFYSEDGSEDDHAVEELFYTIDATPGTKSGPILDAAATRMGQVIGFFVHTDVDATGTNALYTVTGMEFGRVMAVNAGADKVIIVQPAIYLGSGLITGDWVPTHSTARAPILVR